jgi:hypothetical protein
MDARLSFCRKGFAMKRRFSFDSSVFSRPFSMPVATSVLALAVALSMLPSAAVADEVRLDADAVADKIAAAWYAQCIGNTYGLGHEHRYRKDPRTKPIEGYEQRILDRLKRANGCFSDDDTDIEYVYLHAMEKYGPVPTLEHLGIMWKKHINRKIWVANEAARTLMARGWLPPQTGERGRNRHWSKIDPQLVNEIWAMTSPAMVDYAADMANWAAHVTNDDWGTHATMWYNAMYAAAFTETDAEKLYRIGMNQLPVDSPMRQCLADILAWHKEHPDDWVAVRRAVDKKWYTRPHSSGVGSVINAAMGAIAMLYGEGDFRKTLDLACMAGYDADNQAATLAGIIAIAGGGMKAIPRDLLMPIEGWEEPFNNFYNNQTRDDLPSAKMTEIVDRIVAQAEKRIEATGGRVVNEGGKKVYYVKTDAVFTPPFELRLEPVLYEKGQAVEAKALAVYPKGEVTWGEAKGLPRGLSFADATLKGAPEEAGEFVVTLTATDGVGRTAEYDRAIVVEEPNLGRNAAEVLARIEIDRPDALRDNDLGTVVASGSRRSKQKIDRDWYGYRWAEPVTAHEVVYVTGRIHWRHRSSFESLTVQVMNEEGEWEDVKNAAMTPETIAMGFPGSWKRYTIAFDPVETRSLRIVGPLKGNRRYTNVAELRVHGGR